MRKLSGVLNITRVTRGSSVDGKGFIETLKKRFSAADGERLSDGALARRLGVSTVTLFNWRKRKSITVPQMVGLIVKIEKEARRTAELCAVRPLVEFLRIAPVNSSQGGKKEIFSAKIAGGGVHPYFGGLRRELEAHSGVYVFYDSRGRALYVGRTNSQSLWAEINAAFNRDRAVQQIKRVAHPQRLQDFRTSDEKRRQISPATVPLHDIAHYVSAYDVADGLIGNIEALLIRGFANDVLNVKMENIKWDTPKVRRAAAT